MLQQGPNSDPGLHGDEVRELEGMRTALASALALVVAGFGAPGPVNLLPLLRIWPLFHPEDISLPELELLCGACGLKLAPVGRDLHAVIIDSAYDKLVMEVSWPIKRPS